MKKPTRLVLILLGIATFFLSSLVCAKRGLGKISHNVTEIEKIAQEAYIYGLPLAVFYETRYAFTQREEALFYVGSNRIGWLREPITPEIKVIVTPNATTLYGAGFLDLSAQPVVVEIPAIPDRYYSFQVSDQYGDFYFYAGSQFTGRDAQKYIFVGPNWKGTLPPEFKGVEIIPCPSNAGFMIARIALPEHTKEEIERVNLYEDAFLATPLAEWLANDHQAVADAKRVVKSAAYKTFPRMEELTELLVEKQKAVDYFQLLSLALNDPSLTKRTDSIKEAETLRRLAKIGVAEGITFDPTVFNKKEKKALVAGFRKAKAFVKETIRKSLIDMNHWMLPRGMGLGNDYLMRAAVADAFWGASGAKSHTGAFCFVDSEDRQLSGDGLYTVTFDMKNLPPVTEFWSIPVYDSNGYFVDNELARYEVNSYMLERGEFYVSPEGTLTFYIQNEKPEDPNQQKNWLPAPMGDFRLTARFYGPYAPLVDGSYKMPRPIKYGTVAAE